MKAAIGDRWSPVKGRCWAQPAFQIWRPRGPFCPVRCKNGREAESLVLLPRTRATAKFKARRFLSLSRGRAIFIRGTRMSTLKSPRLALIYEFATFCLPVPRASLLNCRILNAVFSRKLIISNKYVNKCRDYFLIMTAACFYRLRWRRI